MCSEEEGGGGEGEAAIVDATETNLVALRRTIYLTIQSSLDFEECVHKLLKMELKPGQEVGTPNLHTHCVDRKTSNAHWCLNDVLFEV